MLTQNQLGIIKVVVPAVASSSIVAFYFQMRLKRIGSFENVTSILLERMLTGAERIQDVLQARSYTVNRLCEEMEFENCEYRHVESPINSFRAQCEELREELRANRIFVGYVLRVDRLGRSPWVQ